MNTIKLNTALENVEMTYGEVVDIANDMLKPMFDPINSLVSEINENSAGMPVDCIRNYLLRVQLRAFELAETKEKSVLKADCAEALRKEKYAVKYNTTAGAMGVRDNTAFLETSEEVIIEALYNLVASLLKTKLDSLYRLSDVLKSILMSKMQEAKLSMNAID